MVEMPVSNRQDLGLTELSARFLQLLADPTRRRIFLLLMTGEMSNGELASQLGLAQNLVSHHLRQLRQAGFIRSRRDSRDQRWIYFSIEEDSLRRFHSEISTLFDPNRLTGRGSGHGPGTNSSA